MLIARVIGIAALISLAALCLFAPGSLGSLAPKWAIAGIGFAGVFVALIEVNLLASRLLIKKDSDAQGS
jgi:hypothetical protein